MRNRTINKKAAKAITKVCEGLIPDMENIYSDHKAEIDDMDLGDHLSPEDYYFTHVYDNELKQEAAISKKIHSNKDVVFIYQNSQFVERMFLKLIEDKEGSACSADKSRSIINALVEHYKTGMEIQWDYSSKYSYGCPQKIFTRHSEIIEFYEGVRALYWGNLKRFMTALPIVLMGMNNPASKSQ